MSIYFILQNLTHKNYLEKIENVKSKVISLMDHVNCDLAMIICYQCTDICQHFNNYFHVIYEINVTVTYF